jgi:hypothetical protein
MLWRFRYSGVMGEGDVGEVTLYGPELGYGVMDGPGAETLEGGR